ncbi:unnamed protein product [Pleuronectes platessa]|uniref:Secreted protein n=1 Tax=Pleuronectes platessa TaxID=8262 RepID=A0A9N7Z788_PLEPL|nr:unnamed protein product [Pleuronectes platessa]
MKTIWFFSCLMLNCLHQPVSNFVCCWVMCRQQTVELYHQQQLPAAAGVKADGAKSCSSVLRDSRSIWDVEAAAPELGICGSFTLLRAQGKHRDGVGARWKDTLREVHKERQENGLMG